MRRRPCLANSWVSERTPWEVTHLGLARTARLRSASFSGSQRCPTPSSCAILRFPCALLGILGNSIYSYLCRDAMSFCEASISFWPVSLMGFFWRAPTNSGLDKTVNLGRFSVLTTASQSVHVIIQYHLEFGWCLLLGALIADVCWCFLQPTNYFVQSRRRRSSPFSSDFRDFFSEFVHRSVTCDTYEKIRKFGDL
ncbi:hypothetical protein B0H14DRAFT_797257 [Mycena olivaceomarginata]|nr:hypothetical protein B0H14DRAFT_797257 [Mycena olivaceomarginata]